MDLLGLDRVILVGAMLVLLAHPALLVYREAHPQDQHLVAGMAMVLLVLAAMAGRAAMAVVAVQAEMAVQAVVQLMVEQVL